ncbi:hypothetical protein LNV23_23900, partial [Paucibacter sp. DJ1R-11]|uniref:hypothetical protein n=1 Tax=Paucibacter sp. DJ1R-11 TaxID=2893556 RepID=UPI0021E48A6A
AASCRRVPVSFNVKQQIPMRTIAYFSCAILVALATLTGLVINGLLLLRVQVPHVIFLSQLLSFGSLVPAAFADQIPRPLAIVLGYAMLFLVFRRCWLFVAKKERTPASFVGFQKGLGYVAFCSLLLSALAIPLSLTVGLPVSPVHLIMIPMVCVPWSFFVTEVTGFGRKAASDVAV